MSGKPEKVLVLDGIGGVPLARDLCAAFAALGIATGYLDCLAQKRRPWHGLRAAYAKALDKRSDRDGFNVLPRLVERDLVALVERDARAVGRWYCVDRRTAGGRQHGER